MKLDIVTRQAWNSMVANLTASLSTWQAARKSELDATRTAVADQGAQAANLGNIAKTNGETAVSIAQQARAEALKLAIVDPRFVSGTTDSPRAPSEAEWGGENMVAKPPVGARLTPDGGVQLLTYSAATNWAWSPLGAPSLARSQLDAGLEHAYLTAIAHLIRCPRTLAKLRSGQPVKILGIGSSSMAGSGSTDAATKGFLAQLRDRLAELFPQSVITIVNRGVGSRTLADLEPEMLTYAADQPDLTIITVGWNDANLNKPPLAEFRVRYENLCRSLMAHGSDVLAVTTQRVAWESPLHLQYSRAVQAAADAAGCGFFDRRAWMQMVARSGRYSYAQMDSGDGLHANDLGYAAWAAATAQALYIASARDPLQRVARLGLDATVYTPPLGGGDLPNWFEDNPARPQGTGYHVVKLTANSTTKLSVAFVGTSIRWMPIMADYWPDGLTLQYRIDGGAWVPLASPRISSSGIRIRGGGWLLAEGLRHNLHLVEIEIAAGSTGGTAFMNGWEVSYNERIGMSYNSALVSLHGAYSVLRNGGLQTAGGLTTAVPYATELLVNGANVFLDDSYGAPGRIATHSAGHATLDRIDVVMAAQPGKLTVIEGVPAANPVAPDVTIAGVLLAHVRVPAGATASSAFVITDKRRVAVGVRQQVAPPALTAAPTQADLNAWRTALIAAGVWRT